jgi:endonuclease G
MSVPYALFAASVKLTTSIAGDTLYSGIGNYVIVPGISASNCIFLTDTLPTRDDNMAMGNPSNANSITTDSNNYLIARHQYALSYNNQKGIANWVSWHLSTAWKGAALRCNCFTQDVLLPAGYYRATTTNYTGTGFDRGHLCPSDDRDGSDTDNAATFRMTNIAPQAPLLNQQTWEDLERYCRTLITEGKELYIIAGSYGVGGTGSLGGTTNSIASGKIFVPGYFWKVIVVLPQGTNDLCRVNAATRIIAVAMPNVQSITANPWGYYRTSVDAIESATGLNLLSLVPTSIQTILEAAVDAGPAY